MPFVVSKKKNPNVVGVDDYFNEIRDTYPGMFDQFSDASEFVRFLVDKSARKELKVKSLEQEISDHDVEIEERAARLGLTPEEFGGIKDALEAEIIAAERAGRTESLGEPGEYDLDDKWWTGTEEPVLTVPTGKKSALDTRIDQL